MSIIVGDCRSALQALPSGSVHCCVTSPPYFGLRDYGVDGQLGLEPTPDEFVAAMVEVFREVRRVLRDDGTLWLNLGDSYAAARGGTQMPAETLAGGVGGKDVGPGQDARRGRGTEGKRAHRDAARIGLKHKDLIGIPWRVAFALQADGWYLRQDIIWHKPNPMPESVTDRCTKAHEYIFLMSKGPVYSFDAKAIQEPANYPKGSGNKRETSRYTVAAGSDEKMRTKAGLADIGGRDTRNRRSVWTVTTKPFKGAHFATFPPDLIEPCVLAGCPVGGTVLDPFFGAGTTGLVAQRHGRNYIGVELNQAYADIARERIAAEAIEWD